MSHSVSPWRTRYSVTPPASGRAATGVVASGRVGGAARAASVGVEVDPATWGADDVTGDRGGPGLADVRTAALALGTSTIASTAATSPPASDCCTPRPRTWT